MTKIYIIRHAEAEGNLYRRIHGQYDSTITETGLKQIEALQKRFESIHIDAVYASDLIRTQNTAKAVYLPKGLALNLVPALREIDLGAWEDDTWGGVAKSDPEGLYKFNNDPENWRVRDGEAFSDVLGRTVAAVKELAERHDGEVIALVSHGYAIRSLTAYALGIPMNRISEIPYCDNTAVAELHVDGDAIKLQYVNDSSHLHAGISTLERQDWWRDTRRNADNNLRFAPLDPQKEETRYLAYRREAWMAAHGSMQGYTDEYLDLAKKHAGEHPGSVVQALWGDTPVGLLELAVDTRKGEGAGSIAFCYVEEHYRGKGMGVQLLGQAISVYRPLGRGKLTLHVAEDNRRAVGFYKKYGFEKTGETTGAVGTLYVMEKNITQRIR